MKRKMASEIPTPLNIIPITQNQQDFICTTEMRRNHHDVFLDTELGEPCNYRELISMLFNSPEEDSFNFFINSPGGDLDTAMSIIEALKNTRAHVAAILTGKCHSAASIITMYCHEVIVLDSAFMLVHTASYGTQGNTGNVKAYTDFTTKQVESIIEETYEGFLSKDELSKVKMGVELWIGSKEIAERMQNRAKVINTRMKKEMKKLKDEVNEKV